jgi:hypothetical protein
MPNAATLPDFEVGAAEDVVPRSRTRTSKYAEIVEAIQRLKAKESLILTPPKGDDLITFRNRMLALRGKLGPELNAMRSFVMTEDGKLAIRHRITPRKPRSKPAGKARK